MYECVCVCVAYNFNCIFVCIFCTIWVSHNFTLLSYKWINDGQVRIESISYSFTDNRWRTWCALINATAAHKNFSMYSVFLMRTGKNYHNLHLEFVKCDWMIVASIRSQAAAIFYSETIHHLKEKHNSNYNVFEITISPYELVLNASKFELIWNSIFDWMKIFSGK